MPNLQHILQLYADTGVGTVAYEALQHGVHGFHSLQGGQKSIELFLWPSSPPGAGSEPLGSSGVALGLKSCCVQTSCSTRSGRGRGEAGKANLGPGPALVSGCVSTGKQGSSSAGLGVPVPHPAHTSVKSALSVSGTSDSGGRKKMLLQHTCRSLSILPCSTIGTVLLKKRERGACWTQCLEAYEGGHGPPLARHPWEGRAASLPASGPPGHCHQGLGTHLRRATVSMAFCRNAVRKLSMGSFSSSACRAQAG